MKMLRAKVFGVVFRIFFLFLKGFLKRSRSKDEVQKDKVGKFEGKKVKTKGAVSKNVIRVAISPSFP